MSQDNYNLEDEGLFGALVSKTQRSPFLVVGCLAGLATVGVGAYRFKYRSKAFPMSLFFIQLRVAAQSVVVGTLTVGMAYGMLQEYVFNDKKKPKVQ